jgi:hypothetical protein
MSIFLQLKFHGYGWSRLMSDMSRLEAKVERLTDQLGSKERELQALTSKVSRHSLDCRATVIDRVLMQLSLLEVSVYFMNGLPLDEIWGLTMNCSLYRSKRQQLLTRHSWRGCNMRKMSSSVW